MRFYVLELQNVCIKKGEMQIHLGLEAWIFQVKLSKHTRGAAALWCFPSAEVQQ